METVKVDDKGRVHLTRKLREELHLKPHEILEASVNDTTLILKPFRRKKISKKEDSLDWLMRNPAHVNKEELKKINLEKLEEEAWTS